MRFCSPGLGNCIYRSRKAIIRNEARVQRGIYYAGCRFAYPEVMLLHWGGGVPLSEHNQNNIKSHQVKFVCCAAYNRTALSPRALEGNKGWTCTGKTWSLEIVLKQIMLIHIRQKRIKFNWLSIYSNFSFMSIQAAQFLLLHFSSVFFEQVFSHEKEMCVKMNYCICKQAQ